MGYGGLGDVSASGTNLKVGRKLHGSHSSPGSSGSSSPEGASFSLECGTFHRYFRTTPPAMGPKMPSFELKHCLQKIILSRRKTEVSLILAILSELSGSSYLVAIEHGDED